MASKLGLRLFMRPQTGKQWVCDSCRAFSTSTPLFSGHSRWSTIKHDKAKNDKAKSKERAIISKEIINASQSESLNFARYNPG